MPIEPNSLPAGFASATAGTDIVMQTAAQRNVDLATAFAEILGASFAAAGQPSGVSTSTVDAFATKPSATVSSTTVLEAGKKPVKPHQAADSPTPTSSAAGMTPYPEIPVLMDGLTVPLITIPTPAATDASVTPSIPISSGDTSDDVTQQPPALGKQPQGASKADVNSLPLTFAIAQPSEFASSDSLDFGAMQSSATLVQSAVSLTGSAGSSELPSGTLVQETGTTAIGIEPNESVQNSSNAGTLTETASAVSSTTFSGEAHLQNPSGTETSSNVSPPIVWNGARSAIAAVPSESPASTPSRSFTTTRSAVATEHDMRGVTASSGPPAPSSPTAGPTIEQTSRAMDAATPEGVVGSPSSPTIPLAPAHQQQPSQHAWPEIPTEATGPRDRVAESAATTNSVGSERPISQLQQAKNTPMTLVSGERNVLQFRANAEPRLSEPGETVHGGLPTPTDYHISPVQVESTTVSSAFRPVASAVSNATTLSTPIAAAQAPTSAPPPSPTSSVTAVSVPAATAVLGPNGGQQLTQGASGDPNTVTSRPTIPSAAGTQLSSASLKSETTPSKQSEVESKISQSVQVGPAYVKGPNTTNSAHPISTEKWPRAAGPAVPSISDSPVSLPQASQNTPRTPIQKTNFHLEQLQPTSPSSNGTIDVPHQTNSGAAQAAPNSHLTQSASSKVPPANSSPAPSITVTATEDADSPSMEQGADTAISRAAYSTAATPDAYGSESSWSTWSDVGTTAAFTSDSGAPGAQTQTNTHSSRSQDTTANPSTEPLAPTLDANDAPASTQALSAATSAPKVDSLGSATSDAAAKSTSTGNDLGTPSDIFARKPAENVEFSSGLQAWNGGDNAQTRLIQSANLGGNLNSSEMNIALHAESLGPVELHTRVTGDVVGASIGVERHDAHAMIASELPALHQALNERQLRVGDLSVFQGSVHSGGATGDGRSSQQRETAQQTPTTTGWAAEENSTLPEVAALNESSDSGTLFDSNGRLSVRA